MPTINIKGELTPNLKEEMSPVPTFARKQLLNALRNAKNILISGGGDVPAVLSEISNAIEMLQHFEKENYNERVMRKNIGCASTTNPFGKGMVSGIQKWDGSHRR
jgi:hypothetical protein